MIPNASQDDAKMHKKIMQTFIDFLLDFCVVNSLGFLEGVKMPKNNARALISKFYYKSRGVFYNKILILWYFYFVYLRLLLHTQHLRN